MINGCATTEGTNNFLNKQSDSSNFKKIVNLTLSNVGMGTYLGQPDAATDELVKNAIKKSILSGINVIDTAINYRAQKAERTVGNAMSELINDGTIQRNEIFVSTKNGYVTNDGDISEDFWTYVNREYVSKGVIQKNDISSGYHCMSVKYLEDQLNRSLRNLDFDCIDLMYLHNAMEGQIQDISKDEFMKKLKEAFEFYEEQRKEEKIRFYGMATWECFRVKNDNPQHLSLSDVLSLAKEVGGDEHGFRFIQLPFNLYLDGALLLKNQPVNGNELSILSAAKSFGVGVFTSVPLMQGKLLSPGVMPDFGEQIPSLRALQFIRSTPGVLAPLVGHKNNEHVEQNLQITKIPPMTESEFSDLLKKLVPGTT